MISVLRCSQPRPIGCWIARSMLLVTNATIIPVIRKKKRSSFFGTGAMAAPRPARARPAQRARPSSPPPARARRIAPRSLRATAATERSPAVRHADPVKTQWQRLAAMHAASMHCSRSPQQADTWRRTLTRTAGLATPRRDATAHDDMRGPKDRNTAHTKTNMKQHSHAHAHNHLHQHGRSCCCTPLACKYLLGEVCFGVGPCSTRDRSAPCPFPLQGGSYVTSDEVWSGCCLPYKATPRLPREMPPGGGTCERPPSTWSFQHTPPGVPGWRLRTPRGGRTRRADALQCRPGYALIEPLP